MFWEVKIIQMQHLAHSSQALCVADDVADDVALCVALYSLK